MQSDVRPVLLIPAYKPTDAIIAVAEDIIASDAFQAVFCVNDGSGEAYDPLFAALTERGVIVVRHVVNLGKGAALKTGFNAIGTRLPDAVGIVTADADGQHVSADIVAVGRALSASDHALILGTRTFRADVPLRSRFGNIMTRYVLRIFTGIRTSDTQTGLRGIPMTMVPRLLRLSTRGYDFELDMLIVSKTQGYTLQEVPISTVYIDDNASSHFRPLADSAAIYFVLVRHIGNAIVTAFIDYVVFAIALSFGTSLLTSMVMGRLVAGLFNFFVGRAYVFKSHGNMFSETLRYVCLVLGLMLLSYGAISFLTAEGLTPYIAKIVVESFIFVVSFAAQRLFVFVGGKGQRVG